MINHKIKEPKAPKKKVVLEKHGDVRIDQYFWMQNRDTPEVISYLNEENDYNDRMTVHTRKFRESLFNEMKSRIKEDDESVPYLYNGYWYFTRFERGGDYPLYFRRRASQEKEELLFDCNVMAKEHSFFHLKGISVSPDNRYVAFATDTTGRRIYTVQIRDLKTAEFLPVLINEATGNSTWANDNRTLFFTRKDPKTLRSSKVFKLDVHSIEAQEELVYHEDDEAFDTFVYKSKSRKYLIIGCNSTLTTEFHILEANKPDENFKIFQKRQRGVEYSIAHYADQFYISTNKDKAVNFKLMKTSETKTNSQDWVEVLPHRNDVLIEDIDIFKDYLVVTERFQGLHRIRIKGWDNGLDYYLPFDNETYTAYTSVNLDFDTSWLRYSYNSLTTPASVIDFNMETREKIIRKEQEILGGKFRKQDYKSERVWAKAEDGSKIPISLVYKKHKKIDGNAPLLLYGYGSYGVTVDPYFSSARLSLLDRGFIYGIAHIRGSEYMGRNWYEEGKLLKKKNSFTDFIDCSKFLIEKNYTSAKHLYAMGGSAGGLLMGAIMNMAPELYNGIVASVPFVDVVTTMLDDGIPLTTGEYDEWGNPNDKEYYKYIKSYSPYDNVKTLEYPNLLVTTGYHDSQVQYWEPAKWVAKLRERKKGNKTLLFHVNMDAGHSGASGRFEALKEVAEEYTFLLDLEGISR